MKFIHENNRSIISVNIILNLNLNYDYHKMLIVTCNVLLARWDFNQKYNFRKKKNWDFKQIIEGITFGCFFLGLLKIKSPRVLARGVFHVPCCAWENKSWCWSHVCEFGHSWWSLLVCVGPPPMIWSYGSFIWCLHDTQLYLSSVVVTQQCSVWYHDRVFHPQQCHVKKY